MPNTKRAIYFVVDEGFEPIATATAIRLATLTDADIHIFLERRTHDRSWKPSIDNPRIFYHIDVLSEKLPKDIPLVTTHYFPPIIYLRLFAPEILHSYERVLYLDADIYLNYFPAWIWSLSLPHSLAAVGDILTNTAAHSKDKATCDRLRAIGLKTNRYFNSGVLLIEPKGWNKHNWPQLLRDYFADYGTHVIYGDQDFLNYTFENKWLELSPRFNFQHHLFGLDLEPFFRPCFLHFSSKEKPWWPSLGFYHQSYTALYQDMFAKAAIPYPSSSTNLKWTHRLKNRLRLLLSQIGLGGRRMKKYKRQRKEFLNDFAPYMADALSQGRFADPLPKDFKINHDTIEFGNARLITPHITISTESLIEEQANGKKV